MSGEIWGYYNPEGAVVLFGIVIGILVGIWAHLFYGISEVFSFLIVILFYFVYGFIAYLLVFRKKKF